MTAVDYTRLQDDGCPNCPDHVGNRMEWIIRPVFYLIHHNCFELDVPDPELAMRFIMEQFRIPDRVFNPR